MQALKTTFRAWSGVLAAATLLATVASSAAGGRGDLPPGGRGSGNYLIVAAEAYVGSAPLTEFADAKTAQGFDVMVYSVPAGTTNLAIKAYIESLWGSSDAPDYILLVGDTDGGTSTSTTIPHWTGEASHHACTDLPYACMDPGDDWYPDIAIGRFSVRSVSMLQDVVDKSLFVEAGDYPDPDYVKRAAFLATNDMTSGAEEIHDWVIENYMDPAEFESIRIYARLGGNSQDIADAVNAGCLFVTYGGHSGVGGWGAPSFNQDSVRALSNAGLYGLVFGWSCSSANYAYDECFGETWQRVSNRGAAAYLSASSYIYWGSWEAWEPSRQLERYFFDSFFADDIWEVGPAWQAALYDFLADFGSEPGNEDITRNFFEMMVLLGDPSLHLPESIGFRLNPDPRSQNLCSPPADEAVYIIEVAQTMGFDEPVTLTASGEPVGSHVIFSVNSLPPPFTSVMTIANLAGGSPGEHNIRVTGSAASIERSIVVGLNLSTSAPGAATLTSPPNGALDTPRAPTLTWQPAPQAAEYDLELATDAQFTNVVYSATVSHTSHTLDVNLDTRTLHHWRVRAVNGCGPGEFSPAFIFLTRDQGEYFAEQFTGDFDLEYFTVAFIPDPSGDYSHMCGGQIAELPTDPTDGTVVYLSDDSYEYVGLGGGKTVWLYGVSYDGFYVGSNGYLTFTGGDSNYSESFGAHFNTPRISALFDDLNPSAGGTVSWKQLLDRAAVTYESVPEYGTSNRNTFQIEMFFDGEICVSWLYVDSNDTLVGLSEGLGLPDDFVESDVSAIGACGSNPPGAQNAGVSTPANTPLTIALTAGDDGLPDPPGALTYIIVSLPARAALSDPGADVIDSVPYTLADGGNEVVYSPDWWFLGNDDFAFRADDGGTPPEGGYSNLATVLIEVAPPDPELVYRFPLDSDPGWATEGLWAFGQPTGGGSHNHDPGAGYTGDNVYGYNRYGDYANNMPAYCLTTTAINCRDLLATELRFWRWLGVESSRYDHATIEVSNDNINWTAVWANPSSTVSDASWSQVAFDVSAVADDEPTVYVRWTMGMTDHSNTYPGWNLDDVEIWAVETGPACPGDLDGDGDVDLADLAQLLSNYGMTGGAAYEDGDLDGDGDVDLADLAGLLAHYGEVCP